VLLLAVVGLGVFSSAASAATVSLDEALFCTDGSGDCRYMIYQTGTVLSYAGQGAEANRAVVRRDGTGVVVADAGARLIAGASCVAVTNSVVRCDHGAVPMVGYRLQGGAGDDVITLLGSMRLAGSVGQPQLLLGGAGDDVLSGGDDPDRIAGGPGSDELHGGAGDDLLFDARRFGSAIAAADVDGAESDRADGGRGTDTADYSRRARALTLRLGGSEAGGGEPGERDRLENVENVEGGDGDDVIIGDQHHNRLQGAGGDDRLAGAAGDDELIGGPGADVLRGGSGDDRLGLGDSTGHRPQPADTASCGPGRDIAGEYDVDDFFGDSWIAPDANDELRLDCEDVPFADAEAGILSHHGLDPRPLLRGRRTWIFANPCRRANLGRCEGRLELARPGANAAFASARFTHHDNVRIHLGPTAARRLARSGRVAIRVRAKQLRQFGAQPSIAFVLALRR
jgi:hypothetical protein